MNEAWAKEQGAKEETHEQKLLSSYPLRRTLCALLDFIINLRIAKQIGLTIPPNVLAIADKVIR